MDNNRSFLLCYINIIIFTMKLSEDRIAYILEGFNDRVEKIVNQIKEKKEKEYLMDKKYRGKKNKS